MKELTNVIYERYPNIKRKIEKPSFELRDKKEITFYNLCLFILEPNQNSFTLNELLDYLEGEELVFALKTIINYFELNTDLLINNQHNLLKRLFEEVKMLDQKNLTIYLLGKGYDLGKNAKTVVNVYYKRGKLPNPDLMIFEKPVWFKKTIDAYLKNGDLNHFKK